MEYGAIDLHKVKSQIRVVDEAGAVVLETRITTSRSEFARVFARPAMRVLVESSTESEWVAQTLEALGHAVVVADPNSVVRGQWYPPGGAWLNWVRSHPYITAGVVAAAVAVPLAVASDDDNGPSS